MDLLADIDHLVSRLQQHDLDPDDALQALVDGSGLVRAIAKQTFSFVENDTVVLAGGDRILKLPERPLLVDGDHPLTVTELGDFGGIDFPMVEHRDFERLGAELTRAYPWYWSTTRLMGWPYNRPVGVWAPRVQVTYSHGYQEIPADVVAIVLDVAQVLATNPGSLRSMTAGGYSETYATETLGRGMVADIRSKLSATGRKRGGAFSVKMT